MLMVFFIFFITLIVLLFGWINPTQKLNNKNYYLFHFFSLIILIFFVAFRDGTGMPDYNDYLIWFSRPINRGVEPTVIYILNFIKYENLPQISLFLIYAILSVGIRYIGIIKYSHLTLFSLGSWFCFILILHDMIQIRAAVASALMIFIVPCIFEKKHIQAIVLITIAFLFHRSALLFFTFFLINTKKDYWNLWVLSYFIFTFLSIFNINIFQYIGLSQISVIEGETRKLVVESTRPNMFAPLTLIQTITCFLILRRITYISSFYPISKLWLKIGFLSIFIYGTGLFVVSVRLAELLSTSFIFLFPLLYYSFDGSNRFLYGKILTCITILAYLANYIFIRQFIPF